jgi:hypothetical protein
MGKYESIQKDIFSIFASANWIAENINTYPDNVTPKDAGNEYIRVSILPNGEGINLISVSGVLIIDIFTSAGEGPKRSSLIADKLDSYLVGKTLSLTSGSSTQFSNSAFEARGLDKINPSLHRSIYSISFKHFGVQ